MWIYVVGALALPAVGVLVAWQGVKASSAPPCERPQTPPSPPATPAPAKPVHNPYNYPPPGGGFYWT